MSKYKFSVGETVLFDLRIEGKVISRQKITDGVHEYLLKSKVFKRATPTWFRESELTAIKESK